MRERVNRMNSATYKKNWRAPPHWCTLCPSSWWSSKNRYCRAPYPGGWGWEITLISCLAPPHWCTLCPSSWWSSTNRYCRAPYPNGWWLGDLYLIMFRRTLCPSSWWSSKNRYYCVPSPAPAQLHTLAPKMLALKE